MAAEDLAGGPIGLALNAAQVASWIYDYYPYIRAYNDSPKSIDQLTQAAQGPGQKGYEDHHIVWRESEGDTLQGIPRDKIYSSDNVVRISTLKHWELTGWYRKPNDNFLDAQGIPMTPRDYLVGKDYDERRRVGLMGLRFVGVLK